MEEALIKRVMPHSVEAEQSVVGAMLMLSLIHILHALADRDGDHASPIEFVDLLH